MPAAAWLVVIDMQVAFSDPASDWSTSGYDEAEAVIARLVERHEGRVVWTKFVRDPDEVGEWAGYYDRWSSFRVPEDNPIWDLTSPVSDGVPLVTAPTFSKWGPELASIVGDAPLVMCGVATECCVLSTALGAADTGRQVTVVADACAGATDDLHGQALVMLQQLAPLVRVVTFDQL